VTDTRTPTSPIPATITPAPTARTWLAVATLSLGAFILVATEFLPVGVLPLVAAELGVSTGTAGLMILVPGLVAAISAPLVVVWLARLPRNRLVIVLGVLLVIANIIGALAPSFGVMLAGRVLVGIALGGFWAVVPSLGFRLAGPVHGTRAASIILAGISAGTVVGLPAGQLLGELAGWRAVFLAAAALAATVLVAQLVLLPRIGPAAGMRFEQFARVIRSPMARVGLVATVLIVTGQFVASTFITPFLVDEGGLEPSLVTVLFLGYGIAGVLGTLIGGALIAKSRLVTLVGTAAVLGAILVLLPALTGSAFWVSALFVVWGLLWGIVPLSLQTWMIAAMPHAPEAASAVLVVLLQASIAIGSLLGGLLVDGSGLAVDFMVAGVLVLGAAAYPLLRRRVGTTA